MLRTRNVQPSLWESVLPEVCLRLPVELERVDAWLDDERFFTPFVPHFSARMGRPSVPMETYLRLMFLKHRYQLGYESLCAEVSDSISWRRFCRIDIDGRVPHSTTLMKITTRCGESVVAALNEQLLAMAVEARVVKTGKVRADTTVVSANVKYPTDSGLLASAVVKIGRVVRRIKATGAASRTTFRDRSRAAGRRVRRIASTLRLRGAEARQQAQATVLRITGELAALLDRAAIEATTVARNARRCLRSPSRISGRARGRLVRAVSELDTLLDRAAQVRAQARVRLDGGKPDSATRLVSLHDPQARPIRKGRVDRPVEFGYKAQVVDNADGVVLDHNVEEGNPADGPQLEPAIRRIHRRTGRVPRAVAADRGYGEARIETQLHDLGVQQIAIPRKGTTGANRRKHEQRPTFRRLVKWRTGCEGRISHLKHSYGWHRTRLTTLTGARIWCGHGILAHNLIKITTLEAAQTP
jgi:transposase, IS5 family